MPFKIYHALAFRYGAAREIGFILCVEAWSNMIVFDLKCSNDHGFETWFRDSAAFEAQRQAREIACPICGDLDVGKALMAPNIGAKSNREAAKQFAVEATQALQYFRRLKEHVEANCEDVGPRFSEEARKIHYGKAEARGIYGQATNKEVKELAEEGVPCAPLPWPNRGDA